MAQRGFAILLWITLIAAAVAAGYVHRRVRLAESPALPCAGKIDLETALARISSGTKALLVEGDAAAQEKQPSPPTLDWALSPVRNWAARAEAFDVALTDFSNAADGNSLAALARSVGEEELRCFAGAGPIAAEALTEKLALSQDGALALASEGCRAALAATMQRLPLLDERTVAVHQLHESLTELRAPATPLHRLTQLSKLRDAMELAQPLLVGSPDVATKAPIEEAAAALAEVQARLQSSGSLPNSCLPTSTKELSRQREDAFDESLEQTSLFSRDAGRWHAIDELHRVSSVLDAFFELDFVQRRAPPHCELAKPGSYRWDVPRLQRVENLIETYLSSPPLRKLSTAVRALEGGQLGEVWSALPNATCGKIARNVCVELHDAQVALPDSEFPLLTRLRIQARGLDATRPTWQRIAKRSREFGCEPASFGVLAANEQAEYLIQAADQALDGTRSAIEEELLSKAGLKRGDKLPPKQSPAQLDERARLLRLEIAAIALGLAEPALVHLETLRTNSPGGPAGIDQIEGSPRQPWQLVVDDLNLPQASASKGAQPSDGGSGVFAFERLYAEALNHRHICSVPFGAWRDGVFQASEGVFHAHGRSLSDKLHSTCQRAKQ